MTRSDFAEILRVLHEIRNSHFLTVPADVMLDVVRAEIENLHDRTSAAREVRKIVEEYLKSCSVDEEVGLVAETREPYCT